MAQMRYVKKCEVTFKKVQDRMVDGRAFTMSKDSIDTKAKKQYTHTPIQTIVELGTTTFAPLLHSKEHDKCYPEPSATIADCTRVTTQQLFDVTALVKSISPTRPVNENRVVFDVEIIDGSKTDDEVRTMPLTVWTELASSTKGDAPPWWVMLNDALVENDAQPVAFFRIKGSQDRDGNFSFNTTKAPPSFQLLQLVRDVTWQEVPPN